LATGGVYLAGACRRACCRSCRTVLLRAFCAKGRFANLLREVPVKVVMINAALLGAAIVGLELGTKQTPEARTS